MPLGLKSDVLLKVVRQAKEKLTDVAAHPKAQELLQAMASPQVKEAFAVLKNGCTPKAQFVGAALLWFVCFSWFNKALSLAFVCLHLKAQGAITPKTEAQVGEAVDQIKKRARRMTMSVGAGAMLGRASSAHNKAE